MICILKSYARGVLVACVPLIATNDTNAKAYVTAILAAYCTSLAR
jgi:hypothetical protein